MYRIFPWTLPRAARSQLANAQFKITATARLQPFLALSFYYPNGRKKRCRKQAISMVRLMVTSSSPAHTLQRVERQMSTLVKYQGKVSVQSVSVNRQPRPNNRAEEANCKREPFSTVPFAPDPDFVDRPDILAWIREKCAGQGARAALVGLGGVGYVNVRSSGFTVLK